MRGSKGAEQKNPWPTENFELSATDFLLMDCERLKTDSRELVHWLRGGMHMQRTFADEDLSQRQAGIAFEVEETGVALFADRLRLR
jgi:hypothetical protein